MVNRKNQYPVPKFRNLEEEDKYWQSHSPLMEGYEGKIQKKKQNRASFLSIRLTGEELARLREIASRYGLGPSTYARQVLIQAIESSGVGSLPPPLLISLFSQLASCTGEPPKEYLQLLNECQKQFLEMQEDMAEQIVRTCLPNLPIITLDKLQDKENRAIRK